MTIEHMHVQSVRQSDGHSRLRSWLQLLLFTDTREVIAGYVCVMQMAPPAYAAHMRELDYKPAAGFMDAGIPLTLWPDMLELHISPLNITGYWLAYIVS